MCGIFGIYNQTSNISNTELLYKSLKSPVAKDAINILH